MTTYMDVLCKCSFCKKQYEDFSIQSTSSFGSRDLDIRPASPERYTLGDDLFVCPNCGFIQLNPNSKVIRSIRTLLNIRRLMDSTDYQFPLEGALPKIAQNYVRVAMLLNILNPSIGYYYFLKAAWCCDDCQQEESAKLLRKQALAELKKKKSITEEDALQQMDIMRRAGLFDELISENFSDYSDGFKKVREFQLSLAKGKDSACHQMDEVFEGEKLSENNGQSEGVITNKSMNQEVAKPMNSSQMTREEIIDCVVRLIRNSSNSHSEPVDTKSEKEGVYDRN